MSRAQGFGLTKRRLRVAAHHLQERGGISLEIRCLDEHPWAAVDGRWFRIGETSDLAEGCMIYQD